MLKDFNKFMSQLKETNQTLDFFCDFEKISQKVEDIKLSLCMLNREIFRCAEAERRQPFVESLLLVESLF